MVQKIENFRQSLTAKNYTTKDITKRVNKVVDFLNWLVAEHIDKISYADVIKYINVLQKKDNSTGLINSKLKAIEQYIAYEIATENETLTEVKGSNPLLKVRVRGTKKTIVHDFFSRDELEYIYERYSGKEKLSLSLLIHQGLKALEIGLLQAQHFNVTTGKLYIPAQQKSKQRILNLDITQIQLIRERLQTLGKEDILFEPSTVDNRLFALCKVVRKYCPKVRNAHQFRVSCIVHWLATEGLRYAQYKAGHSHVSSTEKYQVLNVKELQHQLHTLHPLHRL
jgi:integrase